MLKMSINNFDKQIKKNTIYNEEFDKLTICDKMYTCNQNKLYLDVIAYY